jgi:flagellin
MVSINSVSSNSAVLASLRQVNKDLSVTQTRIGTGLKINSASDNAALYATAQSIRADIKTQSTLSAGISVAKARSDAAVAGLDKITDLLTQMQTLSNDAANTPPGDVSGVANKIKALQTQITAVANASGFQNKNFLTDTAATQSVQIGSDAAAILSVGTIDAEVSTSLLGIAIVAPTTNQSDVAGVAAKATAALNYVAGYQATLSTFSAGLESQLDFLTKLDGIKNSALSSLVDADMEAEAAKVTALQVKQQLAYQALAIGNSSASNVLALFQ